MVLPTIMYNIEPSVKLMLLHTLNQISRETGTVFQIQLNTNVLDEAMQEIQQQESIALMILGVDCLREDPERLTIRLGRYAIMKNRDHYVVYYLNCPEELGRMLPHLSRSTGIVLRDAPETDVQEVFTPIFEDYRKMYDRSGSEDGSFINLKGEGKLYRLQTSQLCCIQAVNKMVEFHTMDQVITIYTTMSSVEEMLDDSFIRCHRSYMVNRNKIQYIDFREMLIYLINGSTVPLARSFREQLHSSLGVQ